MSIVETFIDDENGMLALYPNWVKNADQYFQLLNDQVAWAHRTVTLFGKRHPIPRTEAWLGDPGISYRYSGKTYVARGWPDFLMPMNQQVADTFGFEPNSALLNRYADGYDSMGWHADNEPELGIDPTLAIVSFGESRDIHFRDAYTKQIKFKIELCNGSLLIMAGALQRNFQHSVPKRAGRGCRISCTYRRVVS